MASQSSRASLQNDDVHESRWQPSTINQLSLIERCCRHLREQRLVSVEVHCRRSVMDSYILAPTIQGSMGLFIMAAIGADKLSTDSWPMIVSSDRELRWPGNDEFMTRCNRS